MKKPNTTASPGNSVDLTDLISFYPETGRLQFSDEYVSLIQTSALARMKREIVEIIGIRETSRIFCELGFSSGKRDALTCQKTYKESPIKEIFAIGQQAQSIRGTINTKIIQQDIDPLAPYFYEERTFTGNFEVDAILQNKGLSKNAACWMQTGYMSGFASTLLNIPIIYKEIECEVSGHQCCRLIGKQLSDWYEDEIHDQLKYISLCQESTTAPKQRPHNTSAILTNDITIETTHGVIGSSDALKKCLARIKNVANANTSVLFLGETGVGKEKLAQTLHTISNRNNHPFIAINCSAIPDELVESELFGVQKGAYTDASKSRAGRFERANGGTLFLDEIGDLSWEAQTKLLTALQDKEIERVGDSKTISVDVRIVAATSIDLNKAAANGRFRTDLLYRLNVFPIHIPPLRQRKSDIPMFLHHYIKHFSKIHKKNISGISSRVVEQLTNYTFEGNVRELENITERAVILAENNETLDYGHFSNLEGSLNLEVDTTGQEAAPLYDSILDDMTRDQLQYADIQTLFLKNIVAKNNGNISKTARELDMTRIKLEYRLKKSAKHTKT